MQLTMLPLIQQEVVESSIVIIQSRLNSLENKESKDRYITCHHKYLLVRMHSSCYKQNNGIYTQ